MSGPAVIAEYDARWPARAEVLLGEIESAMSTLPDAGSYVYEHIGSTAVPGLAAKPVLDLQVCVPALPDADTLAAALMPTGFEAAHGARPDSPGVYRDIPRPGDTAPAELYRKRLFHSPRHGAILHVRLAGSPFAEFVVVFRDQGLLRNPATISERDIRARSGKARERRRSQSYFERPQRRRSGCGITRTGGGFRNRPLLRAHPAEARRYEAMKRLAAGEHADDPDYDDYTRAKSPYLDEIQPRLRAWASGA